MAADRSGEVLTVRDALALPAFAAANVAAGHRGLERPVRRVHIVDLPGAAYDWDTRDVLLLTAGVGLDSDPARRAELIGDLAARGVAGMVLSVGYVVDGPPPAMVEAADRLGFPLITTPRAVRFIELTEAVFEQLVDRRYAVLRRSSHVSTELTGLALRGGALVDVAGGLADVLDRPVLIEDASRQVLATARRGAVDAAWEADAGGKATAGALRSGATDERLRESRGPVRVPPAPREGRTMERVVTPIRAEGQVHGYLWVLVGDRGLTEVDELAIEHGATVSALLLLKERAVREAAAGLRGDFLEQLLTGAGDTMALSERAHQLRLRLDRAHAVLCATTTGPPRRPQAAVEQAVARWVRSRDPHAIAVWRDDILVAALESPHSSRALADVAALVDAVGDAGQRLVVGLGDVIPPDPADAGGNIRRSYEQAREAMSIAAALDVSDRVVAFSDLGVLHWLWHLPDEARAGNRYLGAVRALAAADRERGTNLVASLEAYLDHGGSLAETAAALFVHRNTLLARVHRISELLAVDLGAAGERLNLHVAVKAYRLHG